MHLVVGGIVGLDRQEGAGPDVQGYGMGRDAFRLERRHQRRGEMQARGRGGDRAVPFGEQGLVVGQVAVVLGSYGRDIGGQGHDPDIADRVIQRRTRQVETQGHQPVLVLVDHGGVEAAEQAGGVCTPALPRLHEGRPDGGGVAVVQGGLDGHGQGFAPGPDPLAHAGQPGRDHPGVVEHQGIAGAQEVGQVADDVVTQRPVPHHQQARGIARLGRTQGDAVIGQVKVEIGGLHVAGQRPRGQGVVKVACRFAAWTPRAVA